MSRMPGPCVCGDEDPEGGCCCCGSIATYPSPGIPPTAITDINLPEGDPRA